MSKTTSNGVEKHVKKKLTVENVVPVTKPDKFYARLETIFDDAQDSDPTMYAELVSKVERVYNKVMMFSRVS